ncbi:MAG TPA: hypothetical protein VGS28_01635 [Candidatus Saccharimonadales bacterium]|nr:hypothetical protein [Candidatus Saccharimonadales bacterium]
MASVCPTITVKTPEQYATQLKQVVDFAERIHIDLADGQFAPTRLLAPERIYFPSDIMSDIHVMYAQPESIRMTVISLRPHMVIFHAESEGNVLELMREVKAAGIKAGLALLPQTLPEEIKHLIDLADHVLLFGGHLGYQGGEADLSLLNKVIAVRALKDDVEIGWDGGVNDENAAQIVEAGVDVLNVGSYIQESSNPKERYETLLRVLVGQAGS